MIKMEAELTALKEELSTRAKPNNGNNGNNGCETPETTENEPAPEKTNNSTSNSVIKKTENSIKDESSEEKN